MAAPAPRQPPKLKGWIVCGGHRPGGGPRYFMVHPEGRLFVTTTEARNRAVEAAETKDWWIEPIWEGFETA